LKEEKSKQNEEMGETWILCEGHTPKVEALGADTRLKRKTSHCHSAAYFFVFMRQNLI
jgi:hypothetical protein